MHIQGHLWSHTFWQRNHTYPWHEVSGRRSRNLLILLETILLIIIDSGLVSDSFGLGYLKIKTIFCEFKKTEVILKSSWSTWFRCWHFQNIFKVWCTFYVKLGILSSKCLFSKVFGNICSFALSGINISKLSQNFLLESWFTLSWNTLSN